MVTSYNLSESQFHQITKLEGGSTEQGVELEWEEGERTLRLHQAIERKPGLVAAFKKSLTSFACVICAFDFEKQYGPLGKAFIECHHILPVAQMRPGEKTKLSDLRAVCSNCHRMLHKASPMLTIERLREMLALFQ
jgi:predicted HNH restriction endonuclease